MKNRLNVSAQEEGAARLHALSGLPARTEIVTSEAPSATALIEHLRIERGARSILVEAGASTAATLYAADGREGCIDELWLSVCLAPELDPADVVGDFVARARIDATLGVPVHAERHEEGGLPWATRVYRRVARGGS